MTSFSVSYRTFVKLWVISTAAIFGLVLPLTLSGQASAAIVNSAPTAKISFTFDDGLASAYTQAAPTLAKYGLTGTSYVTTGCVGMTKVPNTCKADPDLPYMTWTQIKALQNTYGWEVGSHTVSHPLLASTDPDIQRNKLSATQVTQELVNSRSALVAQGIDVKSFAAPYGDYDMTVLPQIARYYSSSRGFADIGYNTWPNNEYLVRDQQVRVGVSVDTIKRYVDTAVANNQWLVLVLHEIKPVPSQDPEDYQYATGDLDAIAAYVKAKQDAGQITSTNVSKASVTGDQNLLASNSSFNSGVANGWTTDSPTRITKDSNNFGSYPDPLNSLKLVSGSTNSHLFSPKVVVNSSTSYLIKNYLNVQKLTSGEVGFYIDEYDANGNWVSGQYRAAERSVFVENLNFTYKPTSSKVVKASLQVFATANSGITAYLDNVQWFVLAASVPPTPTPTNLLPNGSLEAGINQGWRTDSPSSITADNQGNGSPANPTNSIKATATDKNTHLFSPVVAVDATKTYNISCYLNILQRFSGEVGFYIDEYDANGNWVSGQYVAGIDSLGARTVSFQYKASSLAVKKASLQVIIMGGSGIITYIDNFIWL